MNNVLTIVFFLIMVVEGMLIPVFLILGYNDGYRDGINFGKLLKAEGSAIDDIDKAYENFCNLESGDSYIVINGEHHVIDVGYALEGAKLFVDYLKNIYEKNERNI